MSGFNRNTMLTSLSKGCALSLALACLAACNAKDPSQPKPPTPQAGVVPHTQLDALDRAQGVEATLQQAAQRNDAAE